MLSISLEVLNAACTDLNLESLSDVEFEFLEQYRNCIKPVATALTLLEGQNHEFGLYLPVLISLRDALSKLNEKNPKCVPLIEALNEGFKKRLDDLTNVTSLTGLAAPLYIAMVSNPKYKFFYLGMEEIPPHINETVQKLLFIEGKKFIEKDQLQNIDTPENQPGTSQVQDDEDDDVDDGLSFLIRKNCTKSLHIQNDTDASLLAEIRDYLNAPSSKNIVQHLQKFPIIKRIFEKYNGIRTSEAICERLFSFAGSLKFQ